MNPDVLALAERYDGLARDLEEKAIARLDSAIDASYRELEREFLRQYPKIQSEGSLLATQRRAVLINDLNTLLQIIRPEDGEAYQQMFEGLITTSGGLGGDLGGALIRAIAPGSFVRAFAGINLEAAALQARDGVRRLYRYNDEFKSKASAIVEQGLIQGWGARRVAGVLADEMGIAKYNAERIARTEVLSALNDSAQMRYQQNNVEGVQWLTTRGEVCPYCVARNMQVYEVGKVRMPAHPFCRCIWLPWRREWQELGLTDDAFSNEYVRDRLADLRAQGKEPNPGLTPFERAAKLTEPPTPIWKPTIEDRPQPAKSNGKRSQSRPVDLTPTADDAVPTVSKNYVNDGIRTDRPAAPPTLPPQRFETPKQLLQWEDQYRMQSFESAAVFDRNGKQVFFKDGKKSSVGFTNEEMASFKGLALTHNHPIDPEWAAKARTSGISFSPADWGFAASAELGEMRAVAAGYRHSLRPPAEGWNREWWETKALPVYQRHAKEVERTLGEQQARSLKSQGRTISDLSPEEMDEVGRIWNRDYWHEVSRRTANELGVEYKRERWKPNSDDT